MTIIMTMVGKPVNVHDLSTMHFFATDRERDISQIALRIDGHFMF